MRKYHDFDELGVDKEKQLGMPVLITEITGQQTKSGGDYVRFGFRSLYTKTNITANKWNTKAEDVEKKFPVSSAAWVELEAQSYNGRTSFVVKGIDNPPSDVTKDDWKDGAVPFDPKDMNAWILKNLHAMSGYIPAEIAATAYEENADALASWAAAKNIHHNVYGGLSYHQYTMSVLAYYTSKVYTSLSQKAWSMTQEALTDEILKKIKDPFLVQMVSDFYDRYAEDLGTDELRGVYLRICLAQCMASVYKGTITDVVYTSLAIRPIGNLFYDLSEYYGTLIPVMELVDEYAEKKVLADEETEKVMLIKHCLASCPDSGDAFSLKAPAVQEAMIVYSCEQIDRHVHEGVVPEWKLLFTAASIHDLGKIKELSSDDLGVADYTVEGNLFGHLVIGIEMIGKIQRSLPEEKRESKDILKLKSMIASHHRKKEWGGVHEPKNGTEWLLCDLDFLDSRMWIFIDSDKSTDPGAMNDKTSFALGTKAYHSTLR